MADTRSVDINVIVMEKPYDGDSKEPKLPKQKTVTSGSSQDHSNLSASATVLLHEAYKYAKQETLQIVNYELNKYFNLKDDYISQRNLTIAKNIISKGVGMGTAIASGFMMGGVVGGTIATIGTMASLGIDIAQNYDQEAIKLRQMNEQLSYSRQKAGYSLTSESIGENL